MLRAVNDNLATPSGECEESKGLAGRTGGRNSLTTRDSQDSG